MFKSLIDQVVVIHKDSEQKIARESREQHGGHTYYHAVIDELRFKMQQIQHASQSKDTLIQLQMENERKMEEELATLRNLLYAQKEERRGEAAKREFESIDDFWSRNSDAIRQKQLESIMLKGKELDLPVALDILERDTNRSEAMVDQFGECCSIIFVVAVFCFVSIYTILSLSLSL